MATTPEKTILRERLMRVVTNHAATSAGAGAIDVAAAARRTHEQLTEVLAPLISEAGVDALFGRAFDLAQREFPAGERVGDNTPQRDTTNQEPFGRASEWLERQAPSAVTDAAAAIFATFAELLTTLIGEPLTTRYLEKAWPDGFADAQPKGKKA
jgi:hypothetical protein